MKLKAQNDFAKVESHSNNAGFSMIELIIVMVIIAIGSAIALPYAMNYRKLYRSEEQSLKVLDLMREANQMALTRRRTFRFELDMTRNLALIIDENGPGNSDDIRFKTVILEPASELRMDQAPSGVATTGLPALGGPTFAIDSIGHRLILGGPVTSGNSVWAIRFRSDGSVFNLAGNPASAILYVWPPVNAGNSAPRATKEVRAISLFGGSGAVRYWKYDGAAFLPY